MALDLYAIGNALVDREYSVDDELLASYHLFKGTMLLADADQQHAMMTRLNDYTTPTGQISGGSAANTAFAFAALGGSAFYACRVGNDDAGDFYLADLRSAGVQTSALSQQLGQTGTCLVLVTPDGERTMHTHLGITTDLSADQVDLDPLEGAQYLYIEGYLSSSASARQAVMLLTELARRQGTKIAMSLSDPAMVEHAHHGLTEMLGAGVDLLFCNEMEALLFGKTAEIDDALKILHQYAPLVVVTLGANGALISQAHGDGWIQLPIVPHVVDQVLDTNGAGDNFAAGFLFGLSQSMTLSDCGFLASALAAAVVSQYGPRLQRQQYAAILASTQPLSQF